jgi:DNA polymerase III delta prime subunit
MNKNNIPFIVKYKPKLIDELKIENETKKILLDLVNISYLNILLLGPNNCGKSSIINILINEYFKDNTINDKKNNILYINSLREQGINFYRTEVKTFCQSRSLIKNKKKIIIIDNIDSLNEQSQQVFRNCLDKFSNNINIIASSSNNQKVIDNIQSRLLTIQIKNFNKNQLMEILQEIKEKENINFSDSIDKYILEVSNNNIRILLNYLEKIKIYNKKITKKNYKDFCSNISYIELENYTNSVKNKNIKKSLEIIYSLFDNGYSVIDILNDYYNFIKIYSIDEIIKYKIINTISNYISIFHSENESELELCCCTYDLIELFT